VIDNKMFVVFARTSKIEVYNAQTFRQLPDIRVKGMSNPCDIVACHHGGEMYIADLGGCCIWRVSIENFSFVRWLTIHTFNIWTLSLRSQRLLVTSFLPPSILLYSTANKELLRVVELSGFVMHHAAETTRGTIVVCHEGISGGSWPWEVSENCFH